MSEVRGSYPVEWIAGLASGLPLGHVRRTFDAPNCAWLIHKSTYAGASGVQGQARSGGMLNY